MSVRGWLLFAAMSIIWGIPYLLIKVAVEGLSVPVLVFARTAVGALVLIPLTLRSSAWAPVLAHWKPVAVFAFFEIIAAWLLLSDAEQHISSSLTGLLIAASPIVAAVLDRLTGGGQPLVAARYLGDVPTMPMTAACLGLAAVIYAGPAAATWPTAIPETRVLVSVALLAVVCTAFAFIMFFALIREVGAPRALVFTYVNPAVALAAGVIVLNEPLTPWHLAGLALILAGSVLATRRIEPKNALS